MRSPVGSTPCGGGHRIDGKQPGDRRPEHPRVRAGCTRSPAERRLLRRGSPARLRLAALAGGGGQLGVAPFLRRDAPEGGDAACAQKQVRHQVPEARTGTLRLALPRPASPRRRDLEASPLASATPKPVPPPRPASPPSPRSPRSPRNDGRGRPGLICIPPRPGQWAARRPRSAVLPSARARVRGDSGCAGPRPWEAARPSPAREPARRPLPLRSPPRGGAPGDPRPADAGAMSVAGLRKQFHKASQVGAARGGSCRGAGAGGPGARRWDEGRGPRRWAGAPGSSVAWRPPPPPPPRACGRARLPRAASRVCPELGPRPPRATRPGGRRRGRRVREQRGHASTPENSTRGGVAGRRRPEPGGLEAGGGVKLTRACACGPANGCPQTAAPSGQRPPLRPQVCSVPPSSRPPVR